MLEIAIHSNYSVFCQVIGRAQDYDLCDMEDIAEHAVSIATDSNGKYTYDQCVAGESLLKRIVADFDRWKQSTVEDLLLGQES